jgi:RNA-binding protein YlmH
MNVGIHLHDEDNILISRINDMIKSCNEKHSVKYTNFLDERQKHLVLSYLKKEHFDNYLFYGGYENAERCILGMFPEYFEKSIENFPIIALSFKYRKEDVLSHRDFLGALMSRQIKRSMLGDIIVNNGNTVVFVYNTVSEAILCETSKIGSVGVNISIDKNPVIIKNEKFSEITGTVSSLRLDSVLSLALRLSREKASQLIKNIGVNVNFEQKNAVDFQLNVGDKFSVRRYGKFVLFSVNGRTKKDRIHICIKKYI